ncbi:SDR family oxidoreductase [Nocardioides gansuensis]|uniref:SDR family oxidoreductase n=1 Tax=Nocardioides gansuensis TaxID=2138300 RepID=UPI0014020826|nr:SDR family NAD(P)-dependent oxidoreductase [Nocardioides gansuensis]
MSTVEGGGRVVLVTGGGTGLGAATALRLAEHGYRVHVAGRSRASLEAVASRAAGSVVPHELDVRDREACTRVVSAVVDRDDRLDVMVNNAGIFRRGRVSAVSPEDWRATLETNLTGALHMVQAVVAAFRAQVPDADGVRGHVVNVNSGAGYSGYVESAAYTASKFGLAGLSDVLRQEVAAEGVKVTDLVVATAVESDLSDRVGVRRLPADRVARVVRDVLALPGDACVSRIDLTQLPERRSESAAVPAAPRATTSEEMQ